MQKFLALGAAAFLAAAAPAGAVWYEQNGLVVIEMESTTAEAPVNGWGFRTNIGGFTGSGYLEYVGGASYGGPNSSTVINVPIMITTPGRYRLELRSRKDAAASDAGNDTWIRMDNSPWYKNFVSNSPGVWRFDIVQEPTHGVFQETEYTLAPGLHNLQFSGRSPGHKIDRLHLFIPGVVNDPVNTSYPESAKDGGRVTSVDYDFTTGNTHGFAVTGAEGFVTPGVDSTSAGMRIRSGDSSSWGLGFFGGAFEDVVLEGGETWEVTFTVTSEANTGNRAALPTFRLRVGDDSFQSSQLINVESVDNAGYSPVDGTATTYTISYKVPESADGNGLLAFVDWIHGPGSGNDPNLGVVVQRIQAVKK